MPFSSRLRLRHLIVRGIALVAAATILAGLSPTSASAVGGTTVRFRQIAAGAGFSCAVGTGSSLWCWGANDFGTLGNGSIIDSPVPVAVKTAGTPLAGKTIASVAAGAASACATTTEGLVACWGYNAYGVLGDGTKASSTVPVAVKTVGTALAGKAVIRVSVGASYACASTAEAGIACWGDNGSGQLGDGTQNESLVAVAVKTAGSPLAGKVITDLDAGPAHACAATGDGGLACWGEGSQGELGQGVKADSSTPVAVVRTGTPLAGKAIAQVRGGDVFTCARATDGTLACWGNGGAGQLGNGGTGIALQPTAVTIAGTPLAGKTVVSLAAGLIHTCAATSTGSVACWGIGTKIGDGTTSMRTTPTAVATSGTALSGKTVAAVSSAYQHTCALASDGTASCWGYDVQGSLGHGTAGRWEVPAPTVGGILASSTVTQISGMLGHTCALRSTGTVACWGSNESGQIGDGSTNLATVPVNVSTATPALAGKTVTQVSAGYTHTCAITTDNTIACWGNGAQGQLGNGFTASSPVPVVVTKTGTPLAGKTIVGVTAGLSHTCAWASDSTIACWGLNTDGLLGNGGAGDSPIPVAVTKVGTPLNGKSIVSVVVGTVHTCALASDSTLACWGNGSIGRLGNGSESPSTVPVSVIKIGSVLSGKTITQIAINTAHTCARATDGTVACWGLGNSGRMGTGDTASSSLPVGVVTTATPLAGKTVLRIGLGDAHGCAVATDGTLVCWGSNSRAQLGNGSITDSYVPIAVHVAGSGLAGKTVTQLIGGQTHSCALAGGKVSCWGDNIYGQIGIGGGTQSLVPVAVIMPTTSNGASWPFASSAELVTETFQALTKADPSIASRDSWASKVTAGTSTRGAIADALRRGTDNTTNVDPTARLYRAFLGRTPDAGGLNFWIGRHRTGGWTLVRMADSFATSNEFKTRYGLLSNQQFVTLIYTDVLGRTADPAGVEYWTRQLDLKRRTRGSVMVGFSESSEYKTKQAGNTDVAVAYILLLGRAPKASEIAVWTTRSAQGKTHVALLDELLDSPEYGLHVSA